MHKSVMRLIISDIRRYPISYVVEDARVVANNKIIRLGENVPSRMFSSRIRFFLSLGESFSWFANFSRRRWAWHCARTNIWRDFSSSPLPFHSTPRQRSSPRTFPSSSKFPLLVTSFSTSPIPVLFLAKCLLSRYRYLLPFFHITFWSIFIVVISVLHWEKFLVENEFLVVGQTNIFKSYQNSDYHNW